MTAAPAREGTSVPRAASATVVAATAPVRSAARRAVSLLPPVEADGPKVRLGAAYGIAAVALGVLGGVAFALGAAALGATAATQTARSWGAVRSVRYLAFAGGALIPLAALGGGLGVAAAVVGVLFAAVLLAGPRQAEVRVLARVALIPIACGLAVGAPVALRRDGLVPLGVLLACVLLYDATVFVMGADATRRWEGVLPGLAAVVGVMLFSAAVLVPPFRGAAPWLFGALALLTLPAGAVAGAALRGEEPRPVPALRRIDSLLLLAPLWSVLAPFLLS